MTIARRLALAFATGALAACASDVLPRTERVAASPFESYHVARTFYDVVEPGRTTVEDLRRLGVDPASTPNLRVASYVELMRLFLPSDQVGLSDLDPNVQACLNARTACEGWILSPSAESTRREGSVALDALGIQRTTTSEGWSAEILLLLVDEVVVYKLWSGTPRSEERRQDTNPLGPAQDLSGTAKDAIGGAIPKP